MTAHGTERAGGPIGWAEIGLVPDSVIRAGIRRLNRQRLADIHATDPEKAALRVEEFIAHMNDAPVALLPERANEQHYDVPAAFFGRVMGRHRKYSCCFWTNDGCSLDEAEEAALRITCARAGIVDGMSVLELGCGWGSLSLWIAENFPACRLLAVSNSASQREFIAARAQARGLDNLEVVTRDMNDFAPDGRFDRIVSVEMFEHLRNHAEMFRRISTWLKPGGRFFMHIFCHRHSAYAFEDRGPGDWMSRHFFSGGMMPSADLPLRFQQDLSLREKWHWRGTHYRRTAEAWLDNMDRRRADIMPVLAATYGRDAAALWFQRWRIFFMACAELFGHDQGREWLVAHYLFERAIDARAAA